MVSFFQAKRRWQGVEISRANRAVPTIGKAKSPYYPCDEKGTESVSAPYTGEQ